MSAPLSLDLASKKARTRADYVYLEDYRSRWNDNDMFHHLNNPVYGVLIDSIINSYLITRAGYSVSGSEFVGLVGNTYCDYFGSAHYPGMLDVGLRVVKLGKSSVMYEVGVFQRGEEAVKAVGGFIQIWVKRATNRPEGGGIPAQIRRELEPLLRGSEQDPGTSGLSVVLDWGIEIHLCAAPRYEIFTLGEFDEATNVSLLAHRTVAVVMYRFSRRASRYAGARVAGRITVCRDFYNPQLALQDAFAAPLRAHLIVSDHPKALHAETIQHFALHDSVVRRRLRIGDLSSITE